jgi:hypothetical protein
MKRIMLLRLRQRVINHFRTKSEISRLNREKETYLLQRYAFAKVEVD